MVDFAELGIEFENVVFDEKYIKIEEEESPSEFYNEGCKYFEAKQYKEALECFKKAASKNHADALFHVGKIYDLALGVEQDYRLAAEYYSKAVSFNSGKAANNLANMYKNGDGLEKDMKKAIELYKKGIDGGSYVAMANLGDMYRLGEGVEQNYEEAMKWYRKAADGGLACAMSNIGDLYYNGNGVTKNYEEAVSWYKKASEQNRAFYMLGWCYEFGQGVSKDYYAALDNYKKAVENGNYSSSYKWDPTYRAARLMYKEFNERTKAREYIGSHYDGNKMKAFLDKIIENVKSLSIDYSGFVKSSFYASFTVSGEREAKLELFKAAERELREFKSNIANGANEKVNNFTNELRDIIDIIDWVYELNLDGKYNQYINESIRSCLNSLPVPDAEDLCYDCEQTNDSLYNRGSFFSPEYWYCYQYTGYDFMRKCFDTVDSQLKAMCDEIKKDLLNICNELKASYK